jgi:hypothetical protein
MPQQGGSIERERTSAKRCGEREVVDLRCGNAMAQLYQTLCHSVSHTTSTSTFIFISISILISISVDLALEAALAIYAVAPAQA